VTSSTGPPTLEGLASRARLHYLDVAVHLLHSIAVVVVLALAATGCDERARASPPNAMSPPSAAPTFSARAAVPAASSSALVEKAELKLLKLVFTSEVKSKEPADKLDHAQPGQRVWAHLTMRNRGAEPRQISLVFRVNDEQRSKVNLEIEPSWSFRTWAYSTLRAGDRTGELAVEVRDDAGALVTTARLPIKVDSSKPLPASPARLDE
jgi:hypothetical protein